MRQSLLVGVSPWVLSACVEVRLGVTEKFGQEIGGACGVDARGCRCKNSRRREIGC